MESTRLENAISVAETGSFPPQPERLSRRNRSIVVDADFLDGEHCVVWFVRRGHSGTPVDEFLRLNKVDGRWEMVGGGGAEPGANLATRPTQDEVDARNGQSFLGDCSFGFVGGGSSGSRRNPSYRYLQCAQSVAELRFSDGRFAKRVAHHGYVIVMYRGRGPTITAFDAGGARLGKHTVKPFSTPPIGLVSRFGSRWRNRGPASRLARGPGDRP